MEQQPQTYTAILELCFKGISGIAAIIAVIIAIWFTRKKLKIESEEKLKHLQKEQLIKAGMGFWSLLAYMTESENQHSVMIWKKEGSSITYRVRRANAEHFIRKLNETNYEMGHGLFLGKTCRDLFYEYRNIIFKILHKESDNAAETIVLKNVEMVQRMKAIYQEAVVLLRQELQLENHRLPGLKK